MQPGSKIGVVGKGGAGKTTLVSLLAQVLAAGGHRVVAVDTDSNPNLGLSLGLDVATVEAMPTLPRAVVVGHGGDCALDELFGSYGIATPSGVTVMSALRVTQAGAGCTCGGHRTVRSLLGEALDEHADVTIVDMEAGIEHLSRSGGTLAHADLLVIVMDPSRKSIVTAARTITLARELGIARFAAVGNKAAGAADEEYFAEACAELAVPLVAVLPLDPAVTRADRAGVRVDQAAAPLLLERIAQLARWIEQQLPA